MAFLDDAVILIEKSESVIFERKILLKAASNQYGEVRGYVSRSVVAELAKTFMNQ